MLQDSATEEEFQNFMQRVDEIGSIVKGMSSKDPKEIERATRKADIILNTKDQEVIDDGYKVTKDKTGINKKAYDAGPSKPEDQESMNQEAFMSCMEKDAKQRAQDKRERKELSDNHKRQANDAFRDKHYEKALHRYNLAIELIKDSGVLYTNRALTLIHLGLYSKAVVDCDWALKINENNLKAWLYKAKCHHFLEDEVETERCLREAESRHPDNADFIADFKNQLDSSTMNLK